MGLLSCELDEVEDFRASVCGGLNCLAGAEDVVLALDWSPLGSPLPKQEPERNSDRETEWSTSTSLPLNVNSEPSAIAAPLYVIIPLL
jgi:hypothetical protein